MKIKDHEFIPRPFYPDLCDAFLDSDDHLRKCGDRKRDHFVEISCKTLHRILEGPNSLEGINELLKLRDLLAG